MRIVMQEPTPYLLLRTVQYFELHVPAIRYHTSSVPLLGKNHILQHNLLPYIGIT